MYCTPQTNWNVLYSNTVLYEPFVYGFGRMRHEDSASKVRLCKDVGKGGCMVQMKTEYGVVSCYVATSSTSVGIDKETRHVDLVV